MRRVFTVFIILAVVSIALMVRERRSQGPTSDLADSLAVPSAVPISDRIATSAAAPLRATGKGVVATFPLAAGDLEKLHILDQIFVSKNDNDPRLDRELRQLSDPLKSAMVAKYHELAAESRNERGTVVFLIGRNLTRSEDFAFLSDVLREQKCLSLANCKSLSGAGAGGDEVGANDVTLAYPQWVALRFLERQLGGPLEKQAIEALQAGAHSPDRAISQRSVELLRRVIGHG